MRCHLSPLQDRGEAGIDAELELRHLVSRVFGLFYSFLRQRYIGPTREGLSRAWFPSVPNRVPMSAQQQCVDNGIFGIAAGGFLIAPIQEQFVTIAGSSEPKGK